VYESIVTVVGNVADSPRRSNLSSGPVTNFRMASTTRRYDAASQGYVDGRTLWVDVECWGNLSGNVVASISKGDPVIVCGQLLMSEWESDDGKRSKIRIKAQAVGPNLDKGRATFTRDRSAPRGNEATDVSSSESFGSGPFGPDPDEAFSTSVEELEAGRDYEVEGEALDMDDADLPREPAHA
jgi:single-strand DNA-binding protein